jgi:hypothetical protein
MITRALHQVSNILVLHDGAFPSYLYPLRLKPERTLSMFRYYLEDNSVEIVEPQEENSGCPYGKFLHRHRWV